MITGLTACKSHICKITAIRPCSIASEVASVRQSAVCDPELFRKPNKAALRHANVRLLWIGCDGKLLAFQGITTA